MEYQSQKPSPGLGDMRAEIVLLCEDRQTDAFVRRFLAHRFKPRQIKTLPLPDGRQSGEQYVRRQCPAELKAVRHRDGAFLVVVTDADNLTTAQRRQQSDQECLTSGVPRPQQRRPCPRGDPETKHRNVVGLAKR